MGIGCARGPRLLLITRVEPQALLHLLSAFPSTCRRLLPVNACVSRPAGCFSGGVRMFDPRTDKPKCRTGNIPEGALSQMGWVGLAAPLPPGLGEAVACPTLAPRGPRRD